MSAMQCPKCGRRYPPEVRTCPEDGMALHADATVAADDNSVVATSIASPAPANIPTNNSMAAAEDLIGTVLDGKYRLDAPLGAGGMGTVFRATHLLIERPVAVKVLNPRLVTDPASQERLRREARAAGRLRHSNAVAVTDFGQTSDGIVYIVMELLEGVSLRDMLAKRASPLEPELAVEIMLQAAAAVAAAHEAGIIHRDLKPGNIFILERANNAPIVKVLDFGIAKVAAGAAEDGDEGANEVAAAITLTETGVMIGTPRYMSPEQCDGMRLTPAADVYSLGIILYEMLTGAPPFSGPTPLAVALKHSAEAPRPLGEIVPDIPEELDRVVLHALAKSPDERPSDAGEFRRELYEVADSIGLVRASGFSSPTAEMTRGTLRGEQASTPETAENFAPSATDAVGRRAASVEPKAGQTTVVATPALSQPLSSATNNTQAARATTNVLSDARIWLRRIWLQNPAVLIGGGAITLFLCVLLVVWLARSSSSGGEVEQQLSTADSSEPQARAGQTDAAGGVVADAREPQTANDFYEGAGRLFESRDYAAAERDLRRAIELQPSFPEARNRLGRTLVESGKFAPAIEEFRGAIEEREGDFAVANFNLGDALERSGDHREAIKAYEAAIANRGGGYPEAHFEVGRIHFNRNRNDEAAASFRTAIAARDGRDPVTHYYLGVSLARARNYTDAETALRTAIEQRGGDYPEASYALGLLYENTERYGEAVQAYETYLQQQPDAVNRKAVENSLRRLRRRVEP